MSLMQQLESFAAANKFLGPGPLCVALVITQQARKRLPLRPKTLITSGGGQVKGLGKGAVQAILAKHSITRVLAKEGGRTSRNSAKNMVTYVSFLNSLPRTIDLDEVERFWISRVRAFFAAKPFILRADSSLSIRAAVRDLLKQARARQAQMRGARHEGSMVQHLVGAKLDLVLGLGAVAHHPASGSDQSEGKNRPGDFLVGDVAIHVTTRPGEALIQKCKDNLATGLRPLIVTVADKTAVADGLAELQGVADRIDVLDLEQFLAANLHERALFRAENRGPKTRELIERYNILVDAHETDPSLRISLSGA